MIEQLLTNNWEVFAQTSLIPVNECRVHNTGPGHSFSLGFLSANQRPGLHLDDQWDPSILSYGTDNNGQNNSEHVIRLVKVLAHEGSHRKCKIKLNWTLLFKDMEIYRTNISGSPFFLLLPTHTRQKIKLIQNPKLNKITNALILALHHFNHQCCAENVNIYNCIHLNNE